MTTVEPTVHNNYGYTGPLYEGREARAPWQCGITLQQLKDIRKHPKYKKESNFYKINTDIVIPETKGSGIPYAMKVNEKVAKVVTMMVSHAWNETLEAFITALGQLKNAADEVFWVCTFSQYQPEDGAGPTITNQINGKPFESIINCCVRNDKGMVTIYSLGSFDQKDVFKSGNIYTRAWCAFEALHAIEVECPVTALIAIPPEKDYNMPALEAMTSKIETAAAVCAEDDLEMIKGRLRAYPGGYEAVDKILEEARAKAVKQMMGDPALTFPTIKVQGQPEDLLFLAKNLLIQRNESLRKIFEP